MGSSSETEDPESEEKSSSSSSTPEVSGVNSICTSELCSVS